MLLNAVYVKLHMGNTTVKLNELAQILSGYHSRSRVDYDEHGTHWLLGAGNVDAETGEVFEDQLVRFTPKLSKSDCLLQPGDILFMARGAHNYAVLLRQVPHNVLASSSFFVIRLGDGNKAVPEYVLWYLKQPRAQHHFRQLTGQGVHMPVVRRNALEGLHIPVPPLKAQKTIGMVSQCATEEKRLTEALTVKRKELAGAVCRQAVNRYTE